MFVYQKAFLPTFNTSFYFLLQNNLCEFQNIHPQIKRFKPGFKLRFCIVNSINRHLIKDKIHHHTTQVSINWIHQIRSELKIYINTFVWFYHGQGDVIVSLQVQWYPPLHPRHGDHPLDHPRHPRGYLDRQIDR